MSFFAYAIIGFVALQRLVELQIAERNSRALHARGATEFGRAHYPLVVAVHVVWLVAILFALPRHVSLSWPWLAVFVVLQIARVWIIMSLGPYWTTRIITLPGAPLVRRGPYRFLRHPNYAVVAGEIAVLPLVFGEVTVAIIFSILNTAVLVLRIRVEEMALASRRAAPFSEISGA
jgi:methyltransferase